MLKDILSRAYHQARTIWQVARGTANNRRHEALDLFLTSGHTVPRISALLHPGLGGPALLDKQRAIEHAIRAYALAQEKTVLDLREELQAVRLAALKAATAPPGVQAPPTTPSTPTALLGELLGIA